MIKHSRYLPLIPQFFLHSKQQFSSLISSSSIFLLPSNSIDLLPLISSSQSLQQTKQSHALALVSGLLPSSISLSASLILSYAKFNQPNSCKFLFEKSVSYCKTSFLWNTLLRSCTICGVFDVFCYYNHMIEIGLRPDDYTFPSVIKACADHCLYKKGIEIHGFLIKVGFNKDLYVCNTLLLFYSCCCALASAHDVFVEMREKDVVSWNTMIGVFSDNGWFKCGVEVFWEMKMWSGFLPNVVSVVSVLPACAELRDVGTAMVIHGYVVKVGLIGQVRVNNSLLNVYGKCGRLDDSKRVFDEMVEKNAVSWNAVISSFAHGRHYSNALCTFMQMIESKEKPSGDTLSSILPVLVEMEYFDAGKEVHGHSIRTGLDYDFFISNSLIDMYAKAGDSTKASSIFHNMGVKNVVSWNAMVANFAQNSLELDAIDLVRKMQAFGETPNGVTFTNVLPACARIGALSSGKEIHARSIRKRAVDDIYLSNALMDMYVKCGVLDLAQNVFNVSNRDKISYNTLIVGYSQNTDCLKSLTLFKEMGVIRMERDTVSIVGAISASANSAALKSGKEIHAFTIRRLFHTHLFISNSLLDLYMKCGKIVLAQNIFERANKKDVASWNTMILGYGMLGKFETAISLFEAMREDTINHDSISFIAVLSACSHGGLVDEGKKYFQEMKGKGLIPTNMHYTCMVDLLGRAGLMQEMVELIRELPFEPDANIWGAVLGASRIHGNIELAKWAAEHLFVLKPEHSGYYVLLSNMLAEAEWWDEATRVRELMKSKGVKKDPAYSWVQTRNQVHAFLVGESADG
ncbi:pentatricopeptide repeat-containing protein At1g18485-like [Amaranthus tricolor]|uniref:pentatricopeptide repeat-containing protein At1g18485-like n=1 Tax=Amaranthus tricolor TaxID=29722 RepID=UPI00258CEE70|nr:pentatricopeptide repeat-containing protein At1g18485-like [Amaranthus tricolor]